MVKYKVAIRPIDRQISDKIISQQSVLIVQRIVKNGNIIDIPHPISSFMLDTSNNVNTQKARAHIICSFLNYIQKEIKEFNENFMQLREKGIYALNFKHAASFLNYQGIEKKNSFETVKYKEKVLIQFYEYLISKELLYDNVILKKEIHTYYNEYAETVILNPFRNGETKVFYPSRKTNKLNKCKDMEVEAWHLLLEVCDLYCSEITLGLYMQIMGGLRSGEIVNLTIKDLDFDEFNEELYLNIEDHQDELFNDRNVNLVSSQVKINRANQVVLNPYGDLVPIYIKHMKLITDIKEKTNSKYKQALFINKQGLPLTGDNYKDRFYKIKKIFLEELSKRSYSTYVELKERRWGTHIGRGIFTNFIIKEKLADLPNGTTSDRYVADLRGDRTTTASNDYIDQYKLVQGVQKRINNIRNDYENKIKNNQL